MIRDVIKKYGREAKSTLGDRAGVFEVHVDTDNPTHFAVQGAVSLEEFLGNWRCAMNSCSLPTNVKSLRLLGIVHEDGAVMVQLDRRSRN